MSDYSLGWCLNKHNCDQCPGYFQSKIDPKIVDLCFCDCHEKEEAMYDPNKIQNDVWIGCLAVAGLTVIFMLGVIIALVFL